MSSMNKEAIVLKSDGAGRVQTPVARQVELVREFERSGLSGPRFAELAGIAPSPSLTGQVISSPNWSKISDTSTP